MEKQNQPLPKTREPHLEGRTAQNRFPCPWNKWLVFERYAAVAYFLFSIYALFAPVPTLGPVAIPTFSMIHTAAFAVLGFLFEVGRGKIRFWIVFLLLLLYGPTTEILQPLTGRYFEYIDIVEDTLGVAVGVILGFGFKKWLASRSPSFASSRWA